MPCASASALLPKARSWFGARRISGEGSGAIRMSATQSPSEFCLALTITLNSRETVSLIIPVTLLVGLRLIDEKRRGLSLTLGLAKQRRKQTFNLNLKPVN